MQDEILVGKALCFPCAVQRVEGYTAVIHGDENILAFGGVTELLSFSDSPLEMDESTIRKKLKEYTEIGILLTEKQGRQLLFRLAENRVDLSFWEEAAAFFSEEAPCGVIGSYLLDRLNEAPEHFSYKHHYLLHTLDTQILFDVLVAMKEKRCVDIVNFNARKDAEHEHRVYPLRFYISTQTGREYLLAYHYKMRKPMFFRLDTIRSIKAGPCEPRYEKYEGFASKFDQNLWGVSTGGDYSLDHVELTLHVGEGEEHIINRLEREKRHGRIEKIDEHTYRFIADVYDAGEMLIWVRSFIGRVIRFESSNRLATERFYGDIRRMAELYGGGEVT